MKKRIVGIFLFTLFTFSAVACSNDETFENISKSEVTSEKFNNRTKKEVLYGSENNNLYTDSVSYQNLARNPDENKGKLLILTGYIQQVIETDEETQYIILLDENPENIVFAHFIKDNPNYPKERLLEGDRIDFKCGSLGLIDYETTNSGIKTVPNISIHQLV